jgi:hypothetical protein
VHARVSAPERTRNCACPQLRRWGAARRGSRLYSLRAHCSSLLCGDRGPSCGLWPQHSARVWLHARRIRDRGNKRGCACQIDPVDDSVKLNITSACDRGGGRWGCVGVGVGVGRGGARRDLRTRALAPAECLSGVSAAPCSRIRGVPPALPKAPRAKTRSKKESWRPHCLF